MINITYTISVLLHIGAIVARHIIKICTVTFIIAIQIFIYRSIFQGEIVDHVMFSKSCIKSISPGFIMVYWKV